MEEKALLAIMGDMLNYYKRQYKLLVWIVVALLVLHIATIIGFLYYNSQWETTTTTTTTTTTEQSIDGDDGNIVNGDYEENNYGNEKNGDTENNRDNDDNNDSKEEK